jgi:hypothetical protein
MRIVYACNQRKGAHLQLNRFLQAVSNKHQVRVAAFYGQNYECNIDWILDALCDIFTRKPTNDGVALDVYREQVKDFAPDLIISDCEIITSRIANELDIELWQVSPLLLYYGLKSAGNTSVPLSKLYPTLFNRDAYDDPMKALVEISDRTFIYSHLADLNAKTSKNNIEWIRPYHIVGRVSAVYEHNMIGVHIDANKPLIDRLKRIDDSILFTEYMEESHPIIMKRLQDNNEYAGNLRNAKQVITYGCADLLADACYNGKSPWMLPDFEEPDVMACIAYNEYLALGKTLHNPVKDDLSMRLDFVPEYSKSVRFLDEVIDE